MNVILISQRIKKSEYEIKNCLSDEWTDFFNNFDNVLLVPLLLNSKIEDYFNNLNVVGVILSGGNDINFSNLQDRLRYNFDKEIIKLTTEKNIPLLAVCYGCQLLAYMDNLELRDSENHVGLNHKLNFVNKTQYLKNYNLLDNVMVNSYHNKVIYDTKKNKRYKIILKSLDNYVESIESINKKEKILGIMWHPERNNINMNDINLVSSFFNLKIKSPKVIILCAGKGTRMMPYTKNKPKCMVKYKDVPILDYIIKSLKLNNLNDILLVKGYLNNKIPEKTYTNIVNREFNDTNMVHTLFCAKDYMTGNNDLIISYSDIIYSPKIINRLLESKEKVSVIIDKDWYNQWEKRMENPLSDAETLKIDEDGFIKEIGKKPKSYDEIEGQYIGLIKIRYDVVNEIKNLYEENNLDKNMYMTDFLTLISEKVCPIKSIPINGDWCEFDNKTDLNYNLDVDWYGNRKIDFSSKADNLKNIKNILKDINIPKFEIINYYDWTKNKEKILDNISNKFNETIIVRSSSVREDTEMVSNAGKFLSIDNVDPKNKNELELSILDVFKSYGENVDEDQILIQKSIKNITACGVLFTFDCLTNSYYYVLTYDESGKNDSVTSGKYSDKSKSLYKVKKYANSNDKYLNKLINLTSKLEELFDNDKLDIEFCFTKENNMEELYLLQVRPLVINNKKNINDEDNTLHSHKILHDKYTAYINKNKDVFCDEKPILSIMSDWNPAEIIGINSKQNAISLYKYLITDEIAMKSRRECGYRDMTDYPLMITLLNKSYIDVKISFYSFIPKSLDENLTNKLCNYYLNKLKNNTELHDKIEFAICFTCNTFNLKDRLKVLKMNNFSEDELDKIHKSLITLTNNIVKPSLKIFEKELNRLNKLEDNSEKILISEKNIIYKIYELIKNIKKYGTLPFSNLARYGFIGKAILLSMLEKKILSKQQYESFLESLHTISKDMCDDIFEYSKGRVKKEDFLKKYGHLRPGTYDINSKSYNENFNFYFSDEYLKGIKKRKESNIFKITNEKKIEINNFLRNSFFSHEINSESLFYFIKKSIELREYSKFIFTKSLSNVLELIKENLKINNINVKDASYLDIKVFEDLYSNLNVLNIRDILIKNIEYNKKIYKDGIKINLPDIILDEEDLFEFSFIKSNPTFITNKNIKADIIFLSENMVENIENIENKIVCVNNADPGWEWLFSRKVSGLITCYGGMNSHIAIRCQELSIPAAIGCGREKFEKYINKKVIELNCSLKSINYF